MIMIIVLLNVMWFLSDSSVHLWSTFRADHPRCISMDVVYLYL